MRDSREKGAGMRDQEPPIPDLAGSFKLFKTHGTFLGISNYSADP